MASTSNPRFRENNFIKAQLADEAGRYDHAAQFMMEIAKSVTPWAELSLSERKLLSASLKKFLNELRQAWNHIYSKTPSLVGVESELAQLYLNKIAEEIINFCGDAKLFINQGLVISAQSSEARVFYLTLNADLSCYLVDTEGDQSNQNEGQAAILDYKKAKEVAKKELSWLSPARLTLALHMSEFYSEVMEMQEKGMKVASKALDYAIKARSQLLLVEEGFTEEINELLTKLNARVTSCPMYDEDKSVGIFKTPTTCSYKTSKKAGTTETKAGLQPVLLESYLLRPPTVSGEEVGTSETKVLDNSIKGSNQLSLVQDGFKEELNELLTNLNAHIGSYTMQDEDKRAGTSETKVALQPELLKAILSPPTVSGEEIGTSDTKALEDAIKSYSQLFFPEEVEKIDELLKQFSSDFARDTAYVERQVEAFWTQLTSSSKTAKKAGTFQTNAALQPQPDEEAGMSETSVMRPIDYGEETGTSETKPALQHEPVEEAGISETIVRPPIESGKCSTPPPPPPPPPPAF